MRGDSQEHIRSIATRALEMEPALRRAFVVSACEKDPDTLQEVLHLIELAQMSTGASPTQTIEFREDLSSRAGGHLSLIHI